MKLLAIDTSTKVAGVALMDDAKLVCETNLVSGLTHSERLMPIVDGCMRLAGWETADIDVIAVVAGPGSFTGVRIGVATAKGIAEALGCPVVAVNTLEVLAASFFGLAGIVVPILDARREQVYCAVYDSALGELKAPAAMKLSELLEAPAVTQAEKVLFAGDGVPIHHDAIARVLGEKAVFPPPHLALQRAGAAAWLAWQRMKAGRSMDAAELLPDYLRKSQAEQLREQREASHEG